MTGAPWGMDSLQPLRDALPHLGLDAEDLLVLPGAVPPKLDPNSLQASSYIPDFTILVQRLLQLRRPGGTLSMALCGPLTDGASRSLAATQLAIGFTQHGLATVIVDGDFSHPGLSGLLVDPHQEGLVDMVRFGRSCRALLWQPVTSGPMVLGTGSFPLQGHEPFEAEAWRGIVHRVALHSELAIYVGPLRIGEAENPLVSAVDQVVYVASETRSVDEELERLRHSTARVAAVLAFHEQVREAAAAPAPPPRPEAMQPETLSEAAETNAPEVPGAEAAPAGLQDDEIAEFIEEALPETEEPAPPVASQPEAAMEAEVDAVRAAPEQPEPVEEAPVLAEERYDSATRPPEEAAELRRKLGLDEEEFSYSSQTRYSRVPLYLFLVLMATISGFVGWTLWKSHTGSSRSVQVSQPTPAQTPTRPPASSATPPEAAPTGGQEGLAALPTEPAMPEPNDVAAQRPEDTPPVPGETGATLPAEGQEGAAQQTAPETLTPEQTPAEAATPEAGEASQNASGNEAPAVVPPPAGPVYAVHVASYRRMEQANQEIANLRKHGYEGRALRTDLGSKGIWFRVLVGSYSSKEAAEEAREVILKLPEYAFAQVRRVTEP